MRVFSTPKTLALASGLTLAFVTSFVPDAAWAQAKGGGDSKSISVDAVTPYQVRDPYNTQNSWMMIKVDMTARSNPVPTAVNAKWIPDVTVTLTVGWGSTGTPPKLTMAVAGTAKLVALELNTKTAAVFFLSPEFLQSASKNANGFEPGTKPDFFVAQITAAGVPIETSKSGVSSSLINKAYVDGFLSAAAGDITKNAGMMTTTDSTPYFILQQAVNNLSGSVVPALKAPTPSTP